jgi:hypothetical protein
MKLIQIQTKLETASIDDVSIILDRKVSDVGANRTVDYIGTALDNIDSAVNRIDEAIKELQAIKKSAKSQEETIKIGVASWLQENGINKLQGDRISSISVMKKKETIELIVKDEESAINAGFFKMTLDKTALKNAILDGKNVDGSYLETTHNEDSIRLNKCRAKVEDNS